MILDKLFQLMAEKQASGHLHLRRCADPHQDPGHDGSGQPADHGFRHDREDRAGADDAGSDEDLRRHDGDEPLLRRSPVSATSASTSSASAARSRSSSATSSAISRRSIRSACPRYSSDLIMEKRGSDPDRRAPPAPAKSTTIASMLDHRNANRSGHILTIEDPIEFLFKHKKSIVNQRELGMDTLDWNNALKNAMRQAPDCILIGEIRDKETMQAAIAYAQTGHLCLGTLHANNSYHALNRIINFFPLESRTSLSRPFGQPARDHLAAPGAKPDGKRIPTSEVLLNTRHIAELVERGEVQAIKEAMEQSLAPDRRPSSRISSASTKKRRSRSTRRWRTPIRRRTCPG